METQIIDANNTFLVLAHSLNKDKRSAAAVTDITAIRKMMLSYFTRHLQTGKPVILAVDKGSWRKSVFPYYKARRAEERKKSAFPYDEFMPIFETVLEEFSEFSPAIVIRLPDTEADDIIGVLTAVLCDDGVTIHSTDKDQLQLQLLYNNVRQFSPFDWKYVTPADRKYSLIDHIIRGDDGDGVPNIYSPDNCFVAKIRQTALMAQRYEEAQRRLLSSDPGVWSDDPELEKNYRRNRTMVDLREIPDNIAVAILEEYERQLAIELAPGTFNRYLASHGLV